MSTGRRIILFPGMGADARLFEAQRALPDVEIEVPPWLRPTGRESLSSYARRMVDTIDKSRPFVLGGVSLGGMIAWEAARHVPPGKLRGVLLLSTAQSARGVPRLFRWPGRCAAALPTFVHRAVKNLSPVTRKFFGITTLEQARLFQAMQDDADPAFLRWSLGALLRWSGPTRPIAAPVLWVHGSSDRILPCRLASPTHVTEGAGHLMNVTHADHVNRLIADWLNRLDSAESACTPADPARFE